MKQIAEKLSEVISQESLKIVNDKKAKEFVQLLAEMRSTGLLKQPNYDLPMVDTIGKTYYFSINKRN